MIYTKALRKKVKTMSESAERNRGKIGNIRLNVKGGTMHYQIWVTDKPAPTTIPAPTEYVNSWRLFWEGKGPKANVLDAAANLRMRYGITKVRVFRGFYLGKLIWEK